MDGHVACMGGVRNVYKFWLKNLHVDESIILKCVLRV